MHDMRIDHLVWYSADLAAGQHHFAERMDAAPLYGGGEHPGEGTANAVMALGPTTYLEILGRDPGQTEEGLDPEVKGLSGSGLYHWAVGGVDLATIAARAAGAGLRAAGSSPAGASSLTARGWSGCAGACAIIRSARSFPSSSTGAAASIRRRRLHWEAASHRSRSARPEQTGSVASSMFWASVWM
jgi:hypothetical protein